MKKKTFYLQTYGCAYNKVDSQIIREILKKNSFTETSIQNSYFIIINTCAVKGVTENKIMHQLKILSQKFLKKKIIITGCLPQITNSTLKKIINLVPSFSAIIDVNSIHKINLILEEILKGKTNIIIKSEKRIDKSKFLLNYPQNNTTAIIPISEGCLGSCTYCCVKNSRGISYSFDLESILNQVKYQLRGEKKEIFLTAQDCSCYYYNGLNFIDLLREILTLNQRFYLRIGMINPAFFIDFSDDFIKFYQNEKLYKFLHIPIQSGSDEIIKKMGRNYEIQTLKEKLKNLKKEIPGLTIETDIICGFPEENQREFIETLSFIKWLNPEILNISKFSPRPGTLAKKKPQIKSEIIKLRTRELSNLYNRTKLEHFRKWINWKGEILITKKIRKNLFFGKNIYYVPIYINEGKIGSFINIKIEKVEGSYLLGNFI